MKWDVYGQKKRGIHSWPIFILSQVLKVEHKYIDDKNYWVGHIIAANWWTNYNNNNNTMEFDSKLWERNLAWLHFPGRTQGKVMRLFSHFFQERNIWDDQETLTVCSLGSFLFFRESAWNMLHCIILLPIWINNFS